MTTGLTCQTNAILAALRPEALESMLPDLHFVEFRSGEIVYDAGAALLHVYFPVSAVLSMVTVMQDGAAVEVGTIGREGMGGIHAVLGADLITERCLAQIPGAAYCMPIERFDEHFKLLSYFRRLLQRYTQSVFSVMAQSVACNRLHHIDERCARWLLMTHDRVGSDQFALTQEFLAIMLGTNRPGVSVSAASLQRAGYISYTRGSITVKDREGLEKASCECYAVTREHFARLMLASTDGSQGSERPTRRAPPESS